MQIKRLYSSAGMPIADQFKWKSVNVKLSGNGSNILDTTVEVPEDWSDTAATILAHKYLRKAGVPALTVKRRRRDDTPQRFSDWDASLPADGTTFGAETSAKQVFHRLAGHWTHAALANDYIDTAVDAQSYYDEMFYMLAAQIAAPNSPQWFNTGLWWAYGITGEGEGFISELETDPNKPSPFTATRTTAIYKYPQTSACFILGLKDSLLGEGGILDTVAREARIFKYGSGSGVNYSPLRQKGSKLSNGGTSSGMMSFLKLFDVNAGTIKSGGTTRRAARMAIVDADHPEALDFVQWKHHEEIKVRALREGANLLRNQHGKDTVAPDEFLAKLTDSHFEGEPYTTVSGQNANNSLRVSDGFMALVDHGSQIGFLDDKNSQERKKLWDAACEAAWHCGDPGLQFDTTINSWHTIPKVARQNATNPCSEYSFIDNSSCNLASLNLVKFVKADKSIDVEAFSHAVRMWTMTLDISVGMSSFPDPEIAFNSVNYRAIGLGYANLGGALMVLGHGYGSDAGRAFAAQITALMHGVATLTSHEMATELGPFKDYDTHRADVLKVVAKHSEAELELSDAYRKDEEFPSLALACAVSDVWGEVRSRYATLLQRNAQLTLLAPTGTIGLVMDCATTGIEPEFSLVRHKTLAGGGSIKIVNTLIERSLRGLGYTSDSIRPIMSYIAEHGCVDSACGVINRSHIPVFACANDLPPADHLGMMSSVQPFLSGAISKTVNLPNSATVEDVKNTYLLAWKLGLKAVAIYRDGCKVSQPLTAVGTASVANQPALGAPDATLRSPAITNVVQIAPQKTQPKDPVAVKPVPGNKSLTARYKLPSRRNGFTQKASIAGNSLYLRTGEYADGRLGEVFLTLGRDGSTMRHFLDSIAVSISLGLQHGVPLQEYVDAFSDTRSEPSGPVTGSERVRFCSSIMDYIVRELGIEYLHREAQPLPSVATSDNVVPPTRDSKVQSTELPVTVIQDSSGDVVHEITSKGTELIPTIRTLGGQLGANPRYTGDSCPVCMQFTLRRSGSCKVCDSCGSTTGCS